MQFQLWWDHECCISSWSGHTAAGGWWDGERGRLFQNSIEGFFTGIHTLNWVQTKGGSEYPIQKEWVWWRRIHLVYIFESEGVSPFHFNLWQHHHISFYKNRAHKKLFTPLAFDDSMYLVLRLFQFDRLHEEGPQRFFCKFYVNFSDKKDSNEKKNPIFKKVGRFHRHSITILWTLLIFFHLKKR